MYIKMNDVSSDTGIMCVCVVCSQLEKIYDPTNEEDDMVEMEEERLRMREHVMNEVRRCHSLSNRCFALYRGIPPM